VVDTSNKFSSEYLVDKQIRTSKLSDYGTGNGVLKDVMKRVSDYFEKADGNIL
jgi:hypothetical protein